MAGKDFTHLHVHSEYSMLDGAARIDDLVKRTAELGMSSVAVTDHGVLFGVYEFYKKAKAAGIKPIIGMEAYTTPGVPRAVHEKVLYGEGGEDDVSGGGAYHHLTLLAYNNEGLRNLFRISTLSYTEGFYYKPRVDLDLLQTYGKGIIATTGCPSGEVQTRIRRGEYDLAVKAASDLRDAIGFDNLYVELMDHDMDMERRARADLLRLAKDLQLPLVATGDCHYVCEEDSIAHEALLAVQVQKTLSDPTRFKFDGSGYHLQSPAEMRAKWGELPQACDNTLVIAERCDVSFPEGQNLLPKFDVPPWTTTEKFLWEQAYEGLNRRFAEPTIDAQARLEYELGVINNMGFADYFLVVADFIQWAKRQGIRVGPGRGSAAGSLVAYSLGITDLDPLQHGLMFERFLNPDRVTMPDVDIDFDEDRRDEVIAYVKQKYGEDKVAQIVTYGSIGARAAVKDATRVLDFPYGLGEKLNKAMPMPVMGKPMSLDEIFDPKHPRYREGAEFRSYVEGESDSKAVVNLAKGLEGLKRSSGVHAAGVIISEVPLIDVIPLHMRPKDGAIITQFDMGGCEALGLLKMDFLGLRNLTIIEDALANIRRGRNEEVVLEGLSLDDRATFELLASGETLGVFQLDGGPMRGLLRAMRPTSFDDISAVLALYRPGPMGVNAHNDYAERKNGLQPISAIHKELVGKIDDILDETYGLIVYQEQVMAIAQRVAGYTLAQADVLRRAMGKKKKEILDKEFEPFAAGMRANGYSEECIRALWDVLVPFSDYAFNKAHSAAYGLVSYWTAYLKANYTTEYMAALLTSVGDDKEKSATYLAECARLGIPVLPPDVNVSVASYTPHAGTIRFGLAAIRNVGEGVVQEIVAERQGAPYRSFLDFLSRHEGQPRNKKTVESLIKAGAFDSLGQSRRELLVLHEAALRLPQGAGCTFDSELVEGVTCAAEELPKRTLLTFEGEMLGMTVSNLKQKAPQITAVVVHEGAVWCTDTHLELLERLLDKHKGDTEVRLNIMSPGVSTLLRLKQRVTPSDQLTKELAAWVRAA